MKGNLKNYAEIPGVIGAALILAGWLRYSTQGSLLLMSEILFGTGALLVLVSIALGFRTIMGFFSTRSSRLGTNTTILALGVFVILVILNFVGFRHHKRFDLTTEKFFTLSDQTKKIVSGLQKDVSVARFSKTPDAQFDDLMSEYKNLSPHFTYQNVDPQEKPEVAKEYGAAHIGDVIMASGDQKQPIEADPSGGLSESDVTSTLLKITNEKRKTVCFVAGHGEKSLEDGQAAGYAQVDQGLKKENYVTQSINLVSDNGVPPNCDVVVIAGPKQAYFPQEAAMIGKYLEGGGKAFVEVDPDTDPKLDDVLQSWNVAVGKNIVVDASGVGRLLGTGPATPLVMDYGDSPITKGLARGMSFFDLARTVSVADKSKTDPQTVELLKTSARSFTIPKLQKEVVFNPKTDTSGPLSLGVAASRTMGDKEARLVVIGDSDFGSNQWVTMQRNGDLFYNSVDWLAQDENQISVRPKSPTDRRVNLTAAQGALLRWLAMFLLPGAAIIAGIFVWVKRR